MTTRLKLYLTDKVQENKQNSQKILSSLHSLGKSPLPQKSVWVGNVVKSPKLLLIPKNGKKFANDLTKSLAQQ